MNDISIRAYADFREDLERLSVPGLAKKQARIIRKEIYDTIDARVRNSVTAALAARWTPASNPPDADTTVMLALADGEVWQGYFDGTDWIEVSGLRLAPSRVTYWQHTPKHPEDRA